MLSGWIRKLIHHIDKTIEGEVLPLANDRTQEVCALTALLTFRGSMDMEDILSACYLRDIVLLTEGLHCLGPVVAAQRSITFQGSQ